jgi:hypothetical protein
MPASMHPIFPHPEDKGAVIWRYMDFTKYVSMLEHNGLYMCRSDLLGDPFEGSVSQLNVDSERSFFLGGRMPGLDKESAERFLAKQSDLRRSFRKLIYLNCWYLSPVESAAMWGLYSRATEAIAIQSSFTNLFNCLPESHYAGLVRYADYRLEALKTGNVFFSVSVQAQIVRTRTRTKSCSLVAAKRRSGFLRKRNPDRKLDLRKFGAIDRSRLCLAQQSSMVSRASSGRFEKIWVEHQCPAV